MARALVAILADKQKEGLTGTRYHCEAAQHHQQPVVLKHTEVIRVHLQMNRKKQRYVFKQRMAEVFRNYLNGSVCLQRRAPLKLNKQVRLLRAA